jgi:hypothetical protein
MGNKKYPTMPAPAQASSKMGISSQNRAKNIVVMQDNFPNLTRTLPVRGKLKYCLKFSYKYAKVLLIILIFFGMPHSITSIPLIGRMGFSINSLILINEKWRDNQILGLQGRVTLSEHRRVTFPERYRYYRHHTDLGGQIGTTVVMDT